MFNRFSKGVQRELTWIVISFWVFILIGWITELWNEVLIAYVIFYMVRQLWSVHQFDKWLNTDVSFPPYSGFWGYLSNKISWRIRAYERQSEKQSTLTERYRAASMSLPVAIISIDADNQIEWFNALAEKLTAFKTSDIGKKVETLIRDPEFVKYLRHKEYKHPIQLSAVMGVQRVHRCRINPYFKGHRMIMFEDVHDLFSLAQIRKDFIANASHELRTPLTVINGYLETMIDSEMPELEMWHKPMVQMHNQALRMRSIIDDLLTLSKIESRGLVRNKKEVHTDELIEMIATDVQQLYGQNYEFHFSIEKGLHIKGLEESLKSVFVNLVSNAVRYTPEGGRIEVVWQSNDKGATFSVTDTGIGIEQKHLRRLTERFYRVDSARSRDTGGTGLGLAIVKHVLENHSASLKITSKLGEGSTFRCQFSKSVCLQQSN